MIITAYYFKGQDLCTNRKHVEEDLTELADRGIDGIAVGFHSYQFRVPGSFLLIVELAKKKGLKVHCIASRWGGLIAGWPASPCMFTATHPETWMYKADGTPLYKSVSGPISSIYHELTYEYYCRSLETVFSKYGVDGIIWDEIKVFHEEDHSDAAKKACGGEASHGQQQIDAVVDFFSRINKHIRGIKKDAIISTFIFSDLSDLIVNGCASIKHLDFFGCDGRPWRLEDREKGEDCKVLVGQVDRFIEAAQRNRTGTLMLIENQDRASERIGLIQKNLPELLSKKIDHALFYHHPFGRTDNSDQIADSIVAIRDKKK